jgi:3-hydroxyacyl-[acyl-carrier-protein] dehydratase
MARELLADVARLDLSQVIADHGKIYSLLQHAGRFALLDAVVYRDPEQGLIVGYKDVRADDWWAPDHVPGRPIFPGALMVETGAQLSSYDFLLRQEGEQRFIGFGGLNDTRFRGLVEPGVRMHFVSKLHRARSTMFTYFVQGLVDGNLVFETEVLGVAL